tara:strand:- start:1756 stop:2025 length:270 start_codon:yes stop_codon:yes gene_type:complete
MNKDLKKLEFRCWHRGMKEMDLLMGNFFNNYYKKFTKKDIFELNNYVITLSDNDLYNCFIDKRPWPSKLSKNLINKLNIYANKRGLKNS